MNPREKADIVDILRNVTESDAYAHPWTFKQHCLEAATEIASLRRELEAARERNLIANERADNAQADAARARAMALEECAQWHDAKAAHYARQVHDTYGKEDFHRDSAAAIRNLAGEMGGEAC